MEKFKKGDPVRVMSKAGLPIGDAEVVNHIEKTGFYGVRFASGRPAYIINYPPDRLELICG